MQDAQAAIASPAAGPDAPDGDDRRQWLLTGLSSAIAVSTTAAVLLRGRSASRVSTQLLLLVGFLALGGLLWALAHTGRSSRRLVLVASGGLLVLAVIVPPRQSGDVWAYAMYGRIVSHHGANPYARTAADYPDDPWARRVDAVWRQTPSVYGPGFTVISALGTRMAGDSALAARVFFQSLAALAVLLALLLLYRRRCSSAALALVGLNPVIVVSVVNGAHNDALVGLGVLAAVLWATDRRPAAAGLALAGAALVKMVALLPAVAIGVWVWRRHGLRPVAAIAVVCLPVVALGLGLAGGRTVVDALEDANARFTGASFWNAPHRSITRQKLTEGLPPKAAKLAAGKSVARWANALVMVLAGLLVYRRRRAATPAPAVGAALLAYMLAGTYVYPWYLAWGLPALALVCRSRLTWVVAGHGAVLHLLTVPDPRIVPGRIPPLYFLDAVQRLQIDLYRVWLPLAQLILVVALVAVSVRPGADVPPGLEEGPLGSEPG